MPMATKLGTPVPAQTARPTATRANPTETVRPSETARPTATATQGSPAPVVPPPDAASARLQVPEGFALRIYASGLQEPRLMTIGPDGALYVAARRGAAILRLADADRDGLADAKQVVASGLNGPHNLEWYDGSFYVAENNRISKLTDLDGDGVFDGVGERVTVTTDIPSGGGHSSRTVHVGPDGMLYVAAGSSSNNSVETDKRRAAILRFNLDGTIPEDNPFANDPTETRRPVWAEGLRNSVDFLFLPDGRLWADHNGSDGLGNDTPPEEIVIQVERGKHYGWPFCYTPSLGVTPAGTSEVRDTRVAFAAPISSCDQVTPALFTDAAHQAPLGMVRYDKAQFPPAFQDSLLVAYHGSWNADQTPRDCRVQQIVVRDGLPVEARPFVTGFRDSPSQQCGGAWGRPAGLAVGAEGEVFVSDDKNGNVYRVVYVGP
ncbi:MAG: PQQ-dependent sugar dehydrogenase [Chloroflexi bacterium]|nr:PQQ-dependent sugar dehydrogenase [Chloroflexota bacterium]